MRIPSSMSSVLIAGLLPFASLSWAQTACPLRDMGSTIGEQSLGISTVSTPDVNGDGYADWIVGTTSFEYPGNFHPGNVRVYFGGPTSDNVPDLIITGESIGDRFGYVVSAPGDLNGDGHADILVGAYQNDAMGDNTGRAYVFFGGPTLDASPDVVFTGESIGDEFGIAVDGAGDVNGDGFADAIVGARFHGVPTGQGRAYVFFGGPGIDSQPDLILDSQSPSERFAFTVAGGGDVNGDGNDDILVGAYYNSASGETQSGRAYVYFGGPTVDGSPDLVLNGHGFLAHFSDGLEIADVNGDGQSDILVGASQINVATGEAYVYFGGTSLDAVPDLTLGAEANPGDWFGRFLSGGGDLNGDGFADLSVGAPGGNAVTPGRVFVYYGGPSMDAMADRFLSGEADEDEFGWHGSSSLDLSGDGLADLLVGAYRNDAGGTDLGRAYVYHGGPAVGPTADLVITGTLQVSTNLGIAVAFLGDVNADGFPDFLAGATTHEASGGTTPGRVRVYFGGSAVDATADRVLVGESDGDRFGYSAGPAGDVNGDGYDDVIVGAYQNDAQGSNAGRAYVFFGGPGFDGIPDLVLNGENAGDQFGIAVAGVGDVNNDGNDDFLVGARFHSNLGLQAGRAYLYFGGNTVDAFPDLIVPAQESGERFGFTVARGGDLNGDSIDDFLVGAYYSNSQAGRAYVFFGGSSVDGIPDLVLDGEATFDHFSDGLASGDVNGDGFNDILVGASLHGSGAGRAYAYLGGPALDASPDLILDQGDAGDGFGRSIAAGADLDGDGQVDLIVGAPAGGAFATGAVHIFRGGSHLDAFPDASLEGTSPGAVYGFSVAASGADVDGDGIQEFLVGAPQDPTAGLDAGLIELHLCRPEFVIPPEPHILSILDVGNDEGRRVRLRFASSARDAPNSATPILLYETYRRIDPLPGKASADLLERRIQLARARGMRSDPGILRAGWDFVGIVPAHGEGEYSSLVTTLADSTVSNGMHWSVFFVRAATVNPVVFFDSAPDSGYSIDNLPPQKPEGLRAVVDTASHNVTLAWSANLEEDFAFNTLYRGRSPNFSPDEVSRVAEIAIGTTYVDAGAARRDNLPAYYKLSATDEAGNESAFTMLEIAADNSDPEDAIPASFDLQLRTPNPIRDQAILAYDLPKPALVRLAVYDVRGRLVAPVVDRRLPAGRYTSVWERRDFRGLRVAPGVYFYRFETPEFSRSAKLVVVE